MENVTVISHHQTGGGQPLDSFWFSSQECERQGVRLKFLWTGKKSSYLKFLTSRKVVFDGAFALVNHPGHRFYQLSQQLGMQTAVYWHETEWRASDAMKMQNPQHPVLQQVLNNPKAAHFHVCSYGLKMLHEDYGVDKNNLYLLPNISDPSRLLQYQLPLPKEPNLFVGCGIVVKRKGVDLFLDIADKVISQGVEAKFVWIGPFREEYSLSDISEQLSKRGLKDKVFFVGEKANPAEIIAKARAFLLTSRDDPMPKVLMEALALGTSCIGFGVGGVPELLGEYGTIVTPEDTAEFAEKLIQMLQQQDSDSQQQMRRNWYLERYTPAAFGTRFAEAVKWWNGE